MTADEQKMRRVLKRIAKEDTERQVNKNVFIYLTFR